MKKPMVIRDMANGAPEQRGWVPVPDPTKLTTDAVSLAKADIEKLFDTKLDGFRKLVDEKFTGRDTALAAALKAAQDLVRQQNDSNTLAIEKQANATTKQIDALGGRVDDLKERFTEERGTGASGRKETLAYIFSAIAAVASVISIISAIIIFTRPH
jgi:hypothetical protein